MKKIIKNIGSVVSVILMIMPIVIIGYNEKLGNYWWILLILSFCYDYYIYSVINMQNYIETIGDSFEKIIKLQDTFIFPNGEKITDKDKVKLLEEFINNIIMKLN